MIPPVNVRGQMGVQILEAAAGLAGLPRCDDVKDVPPIHVNIAGLGAEAYSQIGFSNPFLNVRNEIAHVHDKLKTPYWEPGVATKIFTHRENILSYLNPNIVLLDNTQPLSEIAMHIRGGDKRIASIESFTIMAKWIANSFPDQYNSMYCYTNDYVFMKAISTRIVNETVNSIAPLKRPNRFGNDHMADWCELYKTNQIFSAPSAFIMSMLIFNPKKRIVFMNEELANGPHANHNDYIFIREAMQFCPNLRLFPNA